MVQLPDWSEAQHPDLASVNVKEMKSELSEALIHLEKTLQWSRSESKLQPFEERARVIRDLASSLRRDLDHVV